MVHSEDSYDYGLLEHQLMLALYALSAYGGRGVLGKSVAKSLGGVWSPYRRNKMRDLEREGTIITEYQGRQKLYSLTATGLYHMDWLIGGQPRTTMTIPFENIDQIPF